MPVSPYPTFPRKREKGQTNRCASFTVVFAQSVMFKQAGRDEVLEIRNRFRAGSGNHAG